MLCDTGPIVGLLVESDPHHGRCFEIAQRLVSARLVTTWPCVTESMYLLHRAGGWNAQDKFWRFMESSGLHVHSLSGLSNRRIEDLMRRYQDAPMDFADASLVAAAEDLSEYRIFTLDAHFRTYLIHDRIPFDIAH